MRPTTSGAALVAAMAAAPSLPALAATRAALTIPDVAPAAAKRPVTVDDLAALRRIDTLALSPDGTRYAISVRRADAENNAYRVAWFVGSTRGGRLVRLGDGGEPGLRVMFTGHTPGMIETSEARWSPDGKWIAFTARRDGAVQLWRSRADGGRHERLTASAGDVVDFAWSEDGRALQFTTRPPRDELRARAEQRARAGYRFDEDLWSFTDFMAPRMIRAPEVAPGVRVLDLVSRTERLSAGAAVGAPQRRDETALVDAITAKRPDDHLRLCASAPGDRAVCVRETAVLPPHVASIDPATGAVDVLGDVNPEFRNIALGAVERFEWDLPQLGWHERGPLAGLYGRRTHGYILYPPDFDPSRQYPVFVDPYMAHGFEPLGAEHPLHAYAAAGMVVLRTQFPLPQAAERAARGGAAGMKQLYAEDLGFPHMTMLMESTLRGLDAAVARGFVDTRRIGIGGVSHGTFVPLYIVQKHDRIAAISISSPSWGPLQHYGPTKKARDAIAQMQPGDDDWSQRPEGRGRAFYSKIDIADHVDQVEAPILMHLAAQEAFTQVRLIRHLADAGKPYDAYVFAGETHIKWQPAHLRTILQRNLDWFRFWLQDHADGAPGKREQYATWAELRARQCRNRRSLRDYCGMAAPAQAS